MAYERRAAAQQDVEDDPEAPQVAALVVEGRFVREHLHHLWGHVLGRAALGEQGGASPIRCFVFLQFAFAPSVGGGGVYRCGELRGRYGGAGTAQLHSAAQVKVTDLHWRHLVEAEGRRALVIILSHTQVLPGC